MDHEEYYSRYDNLSSMIIRAYTLLYMTETIGDPGPCTVDSFNVVGYIDEILIYMLGLTIWQICYDTDSKANTISQLHHDIRGKTSKTPSIPIKAKLEADLNDLRKKYLAHNDKKKPKNVQISIDDLACLLNELRNWLNLLCDSQLDNRVSKITDKQLKLLKEDVSSSLVPFLDKAEGSKGGAPHA